MKQQVSPAMVVVVIVVLVGVIGLVGYKVFGGGRSGAKNTPPPEAQKWLDPSHQMQEHFRPSNGPPAGYHGPGAPGNGTPNTGGG